MKPSKVFLFSFAIVFYYIFDEWVINQALALSSTFLRVFEFFLVVLFSALVTAVFDFSSAILITVNVILRLL